MSSIRSLLHSRLSYFVDWLRPDSDKEEEIREQAHRIREKISGQAQADGLTILSTPEAGSFAKRTGLRRHMTGGSEVEGLDVDLPFVVSPRTKDDGELESLLDRFDGYAKKSYPETERERTKSSINLKFKSNKLSYDLVSMLATTDLDRQIIIRENGERIETSVQKHVQFVRSRTRESNEIDGRVKFNECVRLVKWWREFREDSSDLVVPSIAIELLCADAYAACSVQKTYADTMAQWYGRMAHVVRKRQRVAFSDFAPLPPINPDAPWEVLDPVTPGNNIAGKWSGYEIDELAEWLEAARDTWPRVIRCDQEGKNAESMRHLVELFGTPIKHHCGEE